LIMSTELQKMGMGEARFRGAIQCGLRMIWQQAVRSQKELFRCSA
jgi:hypothetical protein